MTTLTDLLESEQADADLGDELHEVREAALARLDTLAKLIVGYVDTILTAEAGLSQVLDRLGTASGYPPARERIRERLRIVVETAKQLRKPESEER